MLAAGPAAMGRSDIPGQVVTVHSLQGAVGMHDQIAYFARGATSTVAPGVPMRPLQNQWMSIRHCDRESDPCHDAEIHYVVADIGGSLLADIEVKDELLEHTTFIMVSAQGNIDTAVEATKLGAHDFLTKPVDMVRLKILLEKVSSVFVSLS